MIDTQISDTEWYYIPNKIYAKPHLSWLDTYFSFTVYRCFYSFPFKTQIQTIQIGQTQWMTDWLNDWKTMNDCKSYESNLTYWTRWLTGTVAGTEYGEKSRRLSFQIYRLFLNKCKLWNGRWNGCFVLNKVDRNQGI